MGLAAFLLALGAAARVTRFITLDALADPLRARVDGGRTDRKRSYLVRCGWCMSVWIATPAMLLAYAFGDHPGFVIPAAVLTASYVIGLVQQTLDGDR